MTTQPSTPFPATPQPRPQIPGMPSEMNPEIQRLQEENTRQQTMLHAQASELEISRALLAMKDQQLDDYKAIIFTLIGKSGNNPLEKV